MIIWVVRVHWYKALERFCKIVCNWVQVYVLGKFLWVKMTVYVVLRNDRLVMLVLVCM